MKKILLLIGILIMWPWWTVRAIVLSVAGVALLVLRALAAEWGRP